MRRRPPAYASALAYTTPTSSAPTSPGPAVTATASTAETRTPASTSARSTVAGSAARCARLASSGTTPPKIWWMSCERITRLASSPETSTAADVSSHDVSMPRTTSATTGPAAQRDGVGDGAGGDARWGDDGEPADGAAVRRGARDVRDDPQAVAREPLHPLLGATHGDGHARGRNDETGRRAGARLDGDAAERALGDRPHFPGDGDLPGRDPHDAEDRRVDRDRAGECSRHVRDLRRDRRDRLDRGEVLVGADEPRDRRRDRDAAVQDLPRFRDDGDERHDADVLTPDAVEGDGDLARADLEHAHVRALGELRLDLTRLETDRPRGGRERVGHAAGHVAAQRAEPQHLTSLAGDLRVDLGELLLQCPAGRQLHVEPELEIGGDGLLQLDRDVQHHGEEDRRTLDGPVAGKQGDEASAHRATAGEWSRSPGRPIPRPRSLSSR